MFRVLEGGLRLEAQLPTSLKELGYAINKENFLRPIDSITNQEAPEGCFKYRISNNQRFNDRHKLHFNRAIREEIARQIEDSGLLERLYLPDLTTIKPAEDGPFLPIYCSPAQKLLAAERVVVIVQGPEDQWLWWSWNDVEGAKSIVESSVLGVARELEKYPATALVMLNPCQLRFSYNSKQPCSDEDWEAQIRETSRHPSAKVLSKNLIPGHDTPMKHVESIFDHFIYNERYINPKAKIDIIGVNGGTDLVCQYLDNDWYKIEYGKSNRLSAVAMANLYTSIPLSNLQCRKFLRQKGRAWNKTEFDKGSVQADPSDDPGNVDVGEVVSPIISLGELHGPQSAFGEAYREMLKWLSQVAQDPDYVNPRFEPKMTSESEQKKKDEEDAIIAKETNAEARAEWGLLDAE